MDGPSVIREISRSPISRDLCGGLHSSLEVLQFAPTGNAESFQRIVFLLKRTRPKLLGRNIFIPILRDHAVDTFSASRMTRSEAKSRMRLETA